MKIKTFVFVTLIFLFSRSAAIGQNGFAVDYLFSIGAAGDSLGQFNHPRALTISADGLIYVADTGNHRVQMFDEKGNFMLYFGGIGGGPQQFDMPSDICTQDGLNIFVADQNNNRIHQLDRKLNQVAIFSANTSLPEEFQFAFPQSIAISSQGDQFILEVESNSVLKFNSFFVPVTRFGSIETGGGVLNQPERITLVGNEFLCATDGQAARLVLFDYFGNFLRYLGETQLSHPVGVTYWREKRLILVTDVDLKEIVAFSLSGDDYPFLPVQKEADSLWESPVDLAIRKNRLYVLDQNKNRILVYRIVSSPD